MNDIDIIIIDFGSQYTNLIARKIKELGVNFLVCDEDNFDKKYHKNIKGIILSGGPLSVNKIKNIKKYKNIFDLNIPILGICYGMQLISKYYGGNVDNSQKREFGSANINITISSEIFKEINNNKLHKVWMSHSDNVSKLPSNFESIATSNNIIAAIHYKNIYGLQFHPEVNDTDIGKEIFNNFIYSICKIENKLSFKNVIDEKINYIKNIAKNEKVLLALSGGVDSLVASVLINKAIGKNLHCFFVDNGLNRKLEAYESINYLRKNFHVNIKIIQAKKLFLKKLKGVTNPERKRKIIGKLFINIFESMKLENNNFKFLGQGTILSDVIESSNSSLKSKVIKSHHNVGGLPKKLNMQILEPLKDLLKDEVRKLGISLGIGKKYIYRQPVPGPGYAIRIIGEVNEKNLKILTKVDNLFIEELKKKNMYKFSEQSFVIFLPVKSVGVMGDYRTYENVIVIRCVETKDFMTAKFSKLPWEFLECISTKIINEVVGINRVVYDITTKPPATIEWE